MGCCNSYVLWSNLPLPTYLYRFRKANSNQHRLRFPKYVCKFRLYAVDLEKLISSMDGPILG